MKTLKLCKKKRNSITVCRSQIPRSLPARPRGATLTSWQGEVSATALIFMTSPTLKTFRRHLETILCFSSLKISLRIFRHSKKENLLLILWMCSRHRLERCLPFKTKKRISINIPMSKRLKELNQFRMMMWFFHRLKTQILMQIMDLKMRARAQVA